MILLDLIPASLFDFMAFNISARHDEIISELSYPKVENVTCKTYA